MADEVSVKFSADIADLRSGLQDAAALVNATASTMRGSAAQIAGSFSALSAAYANSAVQKLQSAREASEEIAAIEREQESAEYQVALNGAKMKEALVKSEVQTSQISRDQELAGLLALEAERETIEKNHLLALQSAYAEGSSQYEAYQAKLAVAASQGALRREQIELANNREIYNDYKRTFDQIGSSVSSSIMGMIEGHESLRQAAQKVLLSIIQDFIQARIRMVADWAAGVAMQVTATQTGETAKTTAVLGSVAARASAEASGAASSAASTLSAVAQQLTIDARAVFGGVFAFLAPFMGPAAAAPASGAAATVLGGIYDIGSWQIPSDQLAMVHQGEMIVPAGATPWAQSLMSNAAGGAGGGAGVTLNHATHFNVSAMDSQDVKRWFKANGKTVMRSINDSVRYGAHLGMSKLS